MHIGKLTEKIILLTLLEIILLTWCFWGTVWQYVVARSKVFQGKIICAASIIIHSTADIAELANTQL
jgi:hypothetical protein